GGRGSRRSPVSGDLPDEPHRSNGHPDRRMPIHATSPDDDAAGGDRGGGFPLRLCGARRIPSAIPESLINRGESPSLRRPWPFTVSERCGDPGCFCYPCSPPRSSRRGWITPTWMSSMSQPEAVTSLGSLGLQPVGCPGTSRGEAEAEPLAGPTGPETRFRERP